jgi:Tfp pilus assembly protein PilO
MAIGATTKWYAGAAAASVVVLGAGWFLLVSPQKTTASEIQAQTGTVAQQNLTTESQIAALKAEFKDLPQLQSQVAAIRTKIPQTPSEPALIRAIATAAAKSGLVLDTMSFQVPQALSSGGAAAPVGGANAFGTAGQVSQLGVTMQVKGSFADTRLFLNSLESMQRAMLVTGVDITRAGATESGATGGLSTTLTARVFMANPGAFASAGGSSTGTTPTTAGASTADAS